MGHTPTALVPAAAQAQVKPRLKGVRGGVRVCRIGRPRDADDPGERALLVRPAPHRTVDARARRAHAQPRRRRGHDESLAPTGVAATKAANPS